MKIRTAPATNKTTLAITIPAITIITTITGSSMKYECNKLGDADKVTTEEMGFLYQ
jgi:hypothetical protein